MNLSVYPGGSMIHPIRLSGYLAAALLTGASLASAGTLEISSNGANGAVTDYYDVYVSNPATPPPPNDSNGNAWSSPAYSETSVDGPWNSVTCSIEGAGYAPIATVLARTLPYCAAEPTGQGGGPNLVDWIVPTLDNDGTTAGVNDQWWTRDTFTLPADAWVTAATVTWAADNHAFIYLNGVKISVENQYWGVATTYTLTATDIQNIFPGNVVGSALGNPTTNLLGANLINDGCPTAEAYDLVITYELVNPTATVSPTFTDSPTQTFTASPTQTFTD